MPVWLLALGLLSIAVLSGIALYLHFQLHRQRVRQRAQAEEMQAAVEKKQEEAKTSIRLIARAYLVDDVELAEASVRIHHLLGYVDMDEEARNEVRAFDEVAKRIAHIPMLEQWRALDRETRDHHRETIAQVESEFEDFARKSAERLKDLA